MESINEADKDTVKPSDTISAISSFVILIDTTMNDLLAGKTKSLSIGK